MGRGFQKMSNLLYNKLTLHTYKYAYCPQIILPDWSGNRKIYSAQIFAIAHPILTISNPFSTFYLYLKTIMNESYSLVPVLPDFLVSIYTMIMHLP